jgi:hypothetical protein
LSEVPPGYVETTLGDLTTDSEQRVPAPDEQFQYVDIASIDRATKRITSPQLLFGRDAPSRARKEIRADDVLVSMTRPNLNAVALVPPEFDRQIASTGFDVLRPIGVEPRWLFYVVRAQPFIDHMSELVQGALYPAVRSKDVRGYVIPLAPSTSRSVSPTSSTQSSHASTPAANASTACQPSLSASAKPSSLLPPPASSQRSGEKIMQWITGKLLVSERLLQRSSTAHLDQI